MWHIGLLNSDAERRKWPHLLVIDGIDECAERSTQVRVLEVLAEFAQSLTCPCAVLLSCRAEVQILNSLQQLLLLQEQDQQEPDGPWGEAC